MGFSSALHVSHRSIFSVLHNFPILFFEAAPFSVGFPNFFSKPLIVAAQNPAI
jgi:hypothetical protein